MTCSVALVGQHGATRSSRQARQARLARRVFRAWPQRRLGWPCPPHFFQKFLRAQKTKLVHASITASSSSAMLEQAWRDTHKRDTLVTTRTTRTRSNRNEFWMLIDNKAMAVWSASLLSDCRTISVSSHKRRHVFLFFFCVRNVVGACFVFVV